MTEHAYDVMVTTMDDVWADKVDLIAPVITRVLEKLGVVGPLEVGVRLTNNAEIQKLNHQYRGKNKPTNVLSFPALDDTDDPYMVPLFPRTLGDIVLAYGIIAEEATAQQKKIDHHLTHLLVHGVLHLLGYDHEENDEAEEMESLEVLLLSLFKISNPYEAI